MNDAKDRPRERFPPPATPYLPVQTGRGHVTNHKLPLPATSGVIQWRNRATHSKLCYSCLSLGKM